MIGKDETPAKRDWSNLRTVDVEDRSSYKVYRKWMQCLALSGTIYNMLEIAAADIPEVVAIVAIRVW
jgi:lipid A disaccharide synthetase